VPTTYSSFLAAVRDDDVSTLNVDGVLLTWQPKTPLAVGRCTLKPAFAHTELDIIRDSVSDSTPACDAHF